MAAAGFLFALLGVWIISSDKDGKELARFHVDDGKTVEISPDNAAKNLDLEDRRANRRESVWAALVATPVKSAFDTRREAIDPYELKVAGGGDAY